MSALRNFEVTSRILIDETYRAKVAFQPPALDRPAEFDDWFQGSSLVDSHGDPMPLYHGSYRKFDRFELGHPPQHGKRASIRGAPGVYLSDDPYLAAYYGSFVATVYVSAARLYETSSRAFIAALPQPFADKLRADGYDGARLTGGGLGEVWIPDPDRIRIVAWNDSTLIQPGTVRENSTATR